jgi:futalosine hydrolase
MKQILVVAATAFEIQPFLDFLKKELAIKKNPLFVDYEIDVLVTGVGIAHTALKLGKMLAEKSYDFAINVGVAGSFSPQILRGSVVEVVSDFYGDLGVEEADGKFIAAMEMGLLAPDEKPFSKGKLWNLKPCFTNSLPQVHGMTVQKVHGTAASIKAVKLKFPDAQIETMEGAAFFQAVLTENISIIDVPEKRIHFAQIRAISNFVEPRNRENWQMKEAIVNLNLKLVSFLKSRQV